MVFGDNPQWRAGSRSVVFNAYTDNLGNYHVLKKFASSKHSGDGVGLAARQVGVGNGAAMASEGPEHGGTT